VAERVDELAERLRALGATPPSTLRQQLDLARLEEDDTIPDGEEMVRRVLADYERLQAYLEESAEVADDDDDLVTEALLEDIYKEQAKSIWMLQAFLGETVAVAQPLARPKAL
jgi:starvation-inducible DNA-binding protein